MAHGWNTCHNSTTPSDSKTLTVPLEAEENFEHHTEQLAGEEHSSSMIVPEEISTSALNRLNSEANSQQDTCQEPPWQEEDKSVESHEGQGKDFETNLVPTTNNDLSCLNLYTHGSGPDPGLVTMTSLVEYSDVSSCSEADHDSISNVFIEENPDPSSEFKNMRSTKETSELNQGPPTGDLDSALTGSDKEVLENEASDNRVPQDMKHENESDDLNNMMDDGVLEEKSLLNPQNQCVHFSSPEGENKCTLKKREQMEQKVCLDQNSDCAEEPSSDCKDIPNTELSSVRSLDLNCMNWNIEEKKKDDAHEQNGCQLEQVSPCESKLDGQENESNPDHEKVALDIKPQSDITEGKNSVNQDVEHSSLEFLESCLGLKNPEHTPPVLSTLVYTAVDQHESNSAYETVTDTPQNCNINRPQPPILMRATIEPVARLQMEEAECIHEPPPLHAYCKGSSEPTQQNDCIEDQMVRDLTITGSGIDRITSEFSLVPSKKLMKKLQPVVLLKTAEQNADDTNKYHCSECKKSMQSSDELVEHYHSEHSQCNFQHCVTCGSYLSNETVAAQHLCWKVNPNYMHQSDALASHTKMNAKYMCKYCHKPFVKRTTYIAHEERHRIVTETRCDCCGLYFVHPSHLKVHKRKTRCLPLILEPQEEGKAQFEVDLKSEVTGGTDSCQMRLSECFVKLVDINKTDQTPKKISCPVCGKVFRLRAQLKSHLRSHTDEKPFQCDGCKKDFKYSWNLNKHKRELCSRHTVKLNESPTPICNLSKRFPCPICPRIFKYSYNRTRHLREQCLKEYTRTGKGKVGNRYKCPLCSETFSMASNCNRHIRKVCFQKFKINGNLNQRKEVKDIKVQFKEEKEMLMPTCPSENCSRHECKLCPAVFAHKSGVWRHMKRHKLLQDTVTPNDKDVNPSNLKQTDLDLEPQSKVCSDLRSLSCHFCERSFRTAHSLNKHLPLHGGKKPYRCLDCGKSFGRRRYLIAHINIHRRKIQCSVCKKILPSIGDLLKHRQSHVKKGMLQCPDCPMQFKYPVYLLRHITTHEKKKSNPKSTQSPPENILAAEKMEEIHDVFKCGVCKKEFVDSKSLSQHCLIHIPKSSDFTCPFCKRDFQSRATLIRHFRIHTGEKPFACKGCGRHFARKEYLKTHEERCTVPKESPPPPRSISTQKQEKSKLNMVQNEVQKKFKCSYCPHVFTMASSLTIHQRAHMKNTLFPCPKCGKYYRRKIMKEHQKNCKDKESQHACRNCGATFGRDETKNAHESKCKGTDSVVPSRRCNVSKEIGTSLKDSFKERCPHCPKRFRYRSYLLRHLSCHLRKKQCVRCGQKCESQQQYLQHKALCDGKEPEVEMKESAENEPMSVNASNLKNMGVTVGGNDGELKCSFCMKVFTKARNLRRHILTHTDVKPYRCKLCESCFSRFDHLKLHQVHCRGKKQRLEVRIEKINVNLIDTGFQTKIQQPNDIFECNVCSKQFSVHSSLARHISMLHSTFKPFSCKRCGNRFTSKKSLAAHILKVKCSRSTEKSMKSHQSDPSVQPCRETSKLLQRIHGHYSNKFKFQCEYCPRRFKNQSQLKIHTRLHTGEKPFGCANCGERFIRRDYVQRHLIKCSGKRQSIDEVLCDRCGGLFTQDALQKHQKTCIITFKSRASPKAANASESKGFSCVRCSSHFLLFSQLQQHFLTKHRSDGLQQADNLEQHSSNAFSVKEESLDEEFIKNLPSSSQVQIQDDTNGDSRTESYPEGAELEFNDDTVLVFNKGSNTTGTGVLQTKFSCKDQEKRNLDRGDGVIHKYQCSECDQSFTDGLRLISHLEDHGREDLERRIGKKHQCHLCGKNFDQAGLLQRHVKTQHQETSPNTCLECVRSFRYPSDLDSHMSLHDLNRPFACNACKLRYWTAKALKMHQNSSHPLEIMKASESITGESPKIFTCHPCSKTYTSRKSYMRHCKDKHKGSSELTSTSMQQHSGKDESADNGAMDGGNEDASDNDSDSAPYFPCHVCGKTFLTSESLEDHQRCHLGEKPHECEECGKCFFQLVNLQHHQRSHKTEFQCPMCGKGFISSFALRKHRHSHVTKRPHRCTKCHLSFTGASQLAEHMISHRDENFPCDLCDATFSCKSSRAEHRKMHTEQEEEIPPLIPPTRQTSPPTVMSNSPLLNNAQQYKYRCETCQLRFQDPEQLSEHGCRPAKERPYSCPECNKHFSHGSHLKKHQLSHQLSGPHSFQCKRCPMSFNQRHHLLTHLQLHGDEEPSDSQIDEKAKLSNPVNLNLDKIYKCPICPESFAQALELANHLSVHSYMCNICNKTFATKQQLEEHEQCHLSAATQYECTECGDSFIGSDAFRQHNCAHQKHSFSDTGLGHSSMRHPRKKRSSGASFNVIRKEEEEEEEVDVGEDFYNCSVCNKRFTSSSSLQEHQKLHEDGRPFRCLVCGKGFAKKKYLTKHQQLHSECPYQCGICSESFKTEANLLSHHRIHDARRKHQCTVCNKAYCTTSDLLKHEKKHPELRNKGGGDHRCDMCYQSFSLLSQLQKHQETHIGQIVYECTECDKAFAFPNLLEEHQQTHAAATNSSHILFQSSFDE